MTWARGIDVSHYQPGTRSFADGRVAAGDRFVWIKTTQGAAVHDAVARSHYANFGAVGLPRGPYHFYDFGASPQANADNFLRTLHGIGTWELPAMLDVERGGHGARSDADELLTCLALVQRDLNRVPVIYTGGWWSAGTITPDPRFASFPLWRAEYPTRYRDGTLPPDGLPSPEPPFPKVAIWQYSDTNGTLDRDVMLPETLTALLGAPAPQPSKDPLMALTDAEATQLVKDAHDAKQAADGALKATVIVEATLTAICDHFKIPVPGKS